jgi:hypothetical protein
MELGTRQPRRSRCWLLMQSPPRKGLVCVCVRAFGAGLGKHAATAVQDLLVASLFRNFLLAERIMRAANCTPVSYPRLPPTHQHHMWQAWDMAAEMCLLQLPQ